MPAELMVETEEFLKREVSSNCVNLFFIFRNDNDRVFVYFTDHGAVGMISFPDGILTVKQLNDVLVWMHKNKKYSQLTFYLEACESGSMFEEVLRSDMDSKFQRILQYYSIIEL